MYFPVAVTVDESPSDIAALFVVHQPDLEKRFQQRVSFVHTLSDTS